MAATGAGSDLQVAYEELRQGGFCTELAGVAPVDPGRPDLEAQRAAAARGCAIERAVIVGDLSRSGDADVCELIERDEGAGIRIHTVDAAHALPPLELPGGQARFGLWDGRLLCTPDSTGTGWRVSVEPSELRLGEVAAVALRSAAAAPAGDELVIGEPLCTSAPLARSIASAVCRPVGAGDSDCSSYHGLIQYVRLLGLVGTPERNGHFYRECFQAVARQGGRRVLVSGAADYNMLAHVLAAYDGIGKRPRVTVLDRCATPLFMSRWYADVRGVGIRTEQADIGGFADAEPYDLICTDSLLTVLDPEQKRRAAAAWARLLAPAGRVITTARIAPDSPDGPVRLAPDRVKAFAEDVREQARRRAGLLDVDPEVLAEEARSYGAGVTVYPFRSTEELVAVFNEASLEVERLDVADVGGRVPRERAGPGGHAPARYARVVGRAR